VFRRESLGEHADALDVVGQVGGQREICLDLLEEPGLVVGASRLLGDAVVGDEQRRQGFRATDATHSADGPGRQDLAHLEA
jgi:hypothetical protein